MSRPTRAQARAALEAVRVVMACDCALEAPDGCRHTNLPELIGNPALYLLWYDYRDAVERTGTDGSAESQRARRRLEDAVELSRRIDGPSDPQ